jgi:hypothetical protein
MLAAGTRVSPYDRVLARGRRHRRRVSPVNFTAARRTLVSVDRQGREEPIESPPFHERHVA